MATDLFLVPNMSGDERISVVRRHLSTSSTFEAIEVDAYVVSTQRYLVVLDTLLCPEDAAALLELVHDQRAGRPLLVANSHADWDHAWGNSFFSGQHFAPILAHEQALLRLRSPEAARELKDFQARSPLFSNVTLTPPTITFAQHLSIHGGDLTIELLHAPGHQPDHSVAWLPELRLLLAFDAVEFPLPLLNEPEGVPLMFETLDRLLRLQPQRVLCSHGKTTSVNVIGENLFYLRTIEHRCRTFLQRHPHISDEHLVDAAQLIGFPFDEVIAGLPEPIDRAFYSQAHNDNIRYMLQWLKP